MMVDGKILCAVSPVPTSANHFPSPTSFYEFDPVANSFTQVNGPTGSTYGSSTYTLRMLDLPDGTVLFSTSGSQLYVYQPGSGPLAAGKPTINSITPNLDGSYHLTGQLLNGISEGAAYGDDAQMNSNYPLVRMTNTVSGAVYYARTYNWSSTSVMTSNRTLTTEFALPAGLPVGNYNLVAVANGIASDPFAFSTSPVPINLFYPLSVKKNAGTLTNAITILLTNSLPTNLVVALTSSVPARLTVPASITILAGQTSTNFNIAPVDNLVHDGNQTVTVTAVAPGFTNVTVSIVIVDDNLPPGITTQPAGQTVVVGGTASFSVVASGKAPLNYYWQRNGNFLPGATNSTYSTNNLQLTASGAQFSCLVSNAFGTTNSAVAVLTVQSPPLVFNGGFETGDFSGWTLVGTANSGSTIYNEVVSANSLASGAGTNFIHSGNYGAFLGDNTIATLSQTLNTVPGQVYFLSFWLANPGSGSGQQFLVNWNTNSTSTNQIYFLSNPPVLSWTNLSFLVAATTTNTVLKFGAANPPDGFGLDDVSVTAIPPAVFQMPTWSGGSLHFTWSALAGLGYQLQYRTNLIQGGWVNLGSSVAATNAIGTVTDTPAGDAQRFYRLLVLP
jgi:hypothetical protein